MRAKTRAHGTNITEMMKSRGTGPIMQELWFFFTLLTIIQRSYSQGPPSGDPWQQERPPNMPQIKHLEVMCSKDHMEVQLAFDKPFYGLVFSKGQYGQDQCVYVHPKSGQSDFRFSIIYNGCGTKPDNHGKFYENTVVVQYDEELIEVWDEAKRLRCEWYNDYEKTATKPPMVIADLDVVELNFRGDNVDCWMEIQNGKGPWASPMTGIVPLGSTLTMVVAINDHSGEFDMRVKSCEASDGINRPISLSDEHGCVLRPKMISKFLKLRSNDGRASVMTYAFFHAFKFPDSMQVHIRCKVEICRFGCPEHCERVPAGNRDQATYTSEAQASYAGPPAAQPAPLPVSLPPPQLLPPSFALPPQYPAPQNQVPIQFQSGPVYPQRRVSDNAPKTLTQKLSFPKPQPLHVADPLIRRADSGDSPDKLGLAPPPLPQPEAQVLEIPIPILNTNPSQALESAPVSAVRVSVPLPTGKGQKYGERKENFPDHPAGNLGGGHKFPYGPRNLNFDAHIHNIEEFLRYDTVPAGSRQRQRRYAIPHDRHVRSAELGVKAGYDVISAVDLAFTPNTTSDGVTIFQGRIREEVVYGICLPAPGFSALFVLLAMSVVISVLVAAFLCYHRQLQKLDHEAASLPNIPAPQPVLSMPPSAWNMVHFLRPKPASPFQVSPQ